MKHLDIGIEKCISEFSEKVKNIEEGERKVPVSGASYEKVLITKAKVQSAFSAITKNKSIKELSLCQ